MVIWLFARKNRLIFAAVYTPSADQCIYKVNASKPGHLVFFPLMIGIHRTRQTKKNMWIYYYCILNEFLLVWWNSNKWFTMYRWKHGMEIWVNGWLDKFTNSDAHSHTILSHGRLCMYAGTEKFWLKFYWLALQIALHTFHLCKMQHKNAPFHYLFYFVLFCF